jgi:ABC-type transport system involved in cytochrome c biogenesis permease subunit
VSLLNRVAPWLFVGVVAVGVAAVSRPPADGDSFHFSRFAQLPVVDGGRVKPYDTVARTTLTIISSRQTVVNEEGRRIVPTHWLLDVITSQVPTPSDAANQYKVFRIEHDRVLELLKLQPRPGSYRYSIDEIGPEIGKLQSEAVRADGIEPAKRDLYDVKILELAKHLQTYIDLAQLRKIRLVPPAYEGEEWQTFPQIDEEVLLAKARQPVQAEMEALEKQFSELKMRGAKFDASDPQVVALARRYGELRRAVSERLNALRAETYRNELAVMPTPAGQMLVGIFTAYRAGKVEEFNRKVAEYSDYLAANFPEQVQRARFEYLFNSFAPFYWCSVLYVLISVLIGVGWMLRNDTLPRCAFALTVFTLALHTAALLARMYLMDRPLVFVTNLYSSAIFIGWVSVGLGLVLERIFQNGLGNMMAAVTGFATMIIAYNLSLDGDTLEMLQAVLDTNFWLATHVTTVTAGYGATFIAGALGIVYVLRGMLTRTLTPEASRTIGRMIYGVVCFALLLSFVGTVLGGIWADQSWGRFWGWDPKENGALMIVMWNALILHARWGGMIKDRGMAVLAIAGNIITAWSWFGVNMLGVGLHSYGFMSGTLFWLIAFVLSQLFLIGLGCLPLRHWASFAPTTSGTSASVNGTSGPSVSPSARVPANSGV